ncbi:MAG: permease-like cell division protein FtsX, partial [Patescibacteria group bacterium]
MISTSLKRVLSGGAKSFVRSGVVSFATVLIMTVTMIIIGSLVFLSAILGNTLTSIKDKVDVNVYFVTNADETDILSVQHKLEALSDVATVTYVSRAQALESFRLRHTDDELTLQALDELGENPLGASLAVKAKDPSKYEGIVKFLSDDPSVSPSSGPIIDRINYYQNKTVIDRLTSAIDTTERAGLAIVLLFALASLIIAFTTIRLAIYTSRDEIAVMRLVGASNMYIRGPFIVAGVMSGVLAALIALLFFYPATWYAGTSLSAWLGGFNLFTYYLDHFAVIFFPIAAFLIAFH